MIESSKQDIYFAHYDENGEYVGFYSPQIHTEIPTPFILLNWDEWQEALTGEWCVIDNKHSKRINELKQDIESLRFIRNTLLNESDWTQLPDSPLSDQDKLIWQKYRQQLRDCTKNKELKLPNKPNIVKL